MMCGMTGRNDERERVSDREKSVLAFWRENNIFEKSENGIRLSGLDAYIYRFLKKRSFVFYDGPPFATGLPHYGHLLVSAVKDAVSRYKTMRGHTVRRRWGWDCHGLPLEVEMEKKIGSTSRKDIEAYGIEKFNSGIRDTVFTYADEWKKIIPRIGRWVDMENDYRTVSTSYMESVWSVFHRLHKNGFVSRGFKSLHLCPRCSTTVSNAEVADSYDTLTDSAVYVLFPLREDPTVRLVAWTTTPWTLFGNIALGVDENMKYTVISRNGGQYVVHEHALHLFKDGEVVGTKQGSELIGKEYIPPFDYLYADQRGLSPEVREKLKNAWRVYGVPYVDSGVGTGIVHLAPAYGSDDMETARRYNLPIHHHVTKDGMFVPELGPFAGLRPKQKGNPGETDEKILAALREKGVLLHSENIEHSYPVCWRCDTPLLNYAADSWFVHTDAYRDRMVAENRKVAWVPAHVRDGRFGNWLRNAQPWAVSRSRFWGAPLPIWQVEKTGEYLIIESLEEMFRRMRANNTFTFIRHGHAFSNEPRILSCFPDDGVGLTEKGKQQAQEVAEKVRDMKPTVIFCSPLQRTRETAEYIARATGAEIHEDPLLTEIQIPEMHGRPYNEMRELVKTSGADRDIRRNIGTGESYLDVFKRTLEFLEKVDRQYTDAHIIVVTHKIVMTNARMVESITAAKNDHMRRYTLPGNGNTAMFTLHYKQVKRTDDGEIDLHRPYIDSVVLYDDDGNPARHIGEVFDCWFESGAMPYGSNQYPFLKTPFFNPLKNIGFPADFVCEAMDQTRGWFYSLMAIGVGAFGKMPYRRVIATGLIHAEDGKKMSKSLKNYSDPMDIVERYGADSLRHYLLASPVTRGETLNFKDSQVDEIYKKVYTRLHNCYNFYTTYGHLPHEKGSTHPLDIYILSRLGEMHRAMTRGFERYRLDEAATPIGGFVEDLSVWYLRRSRNRMRHDTKDGAHARETMRTVLTECAKCIAPVAPFHAEHLFLRMRKHSPNILPESVHLCSWPKKMPINTKAVAMMDTVRDVVSAAHEQRAQAGIKVRQPLARVTIQTDIPEHLREIIAEEIHVKQVAVAKDAGKKVVLDTELTPELIAEGFVREYVRSVQNLRKEQQLSMTETVAAVRTHLPDEQRAYLQRHEDSVKAEIRAERIIYDDRPIDDGQTVTIGDVPVSLLLKRRQEQS